MNITKKVESEIIKYCEKYPLQFYYDYNDQLSKDQIIKMLESKTPLNDLEDEVWEWNIDYIGEMEDNFIEEIYKEFDIDRAKLEDEQEVYDMIREHIILDTNIKELLRNTGDLTCLIKVYSNYDCCNSFTPVKEHGFYPAEVFDRVKSGVKRADYEYEFNNGAYGGSLFCFIFKTDIETLLDIKKQMMTAKTVTIPKGTQFGFFSSFQGAGSLFYKQTYRNMTIPVKESEYDCIDIIADIEQSYSMDDVYGGIRVDDQNITLA